MKKYFAHERELIQGLKKQIKEVENKIEQKNLDKILIEKSKETA